ncbi:MAG: hypothetical protein AB1772_03670 [Candidatus Zixiibacteriota bacterium]
MKIAARHYCFIGLAVVVVIAMLIDYRPELEVSDESRRMFEYLDSLPEGSLLLISFDHEASAMPEIRPLALALLRHAFARRHRLIGIALMAEGTGIGYGLMNQMAKEYNCEYGSDYVYLGFKPQYIAAILSMGESLPQTFPDDYTGRAWADLSMLAGVRNYGDLAGVISIADGSMVMHWVEYGKGRYGVPVSAFVAAAMVTTFDPYLASGQLTAMVGGLRGAAEYEQLIGRPGAGARAMLAQTSMHIYVVALIVIGNVVYFVGRRKGRGR